MKVVMSDIPMANLQGEAATECPNLGLLSLVSYVRERVHDIEWFYLEPWLTKTEHFQRLKEISPDAYCVSFTTPKKMLAFEILKQVRGSFPDMPIVAGGAHPTVNPCEVLGEGCVDVCVVGEGEQAFLNLVKKQFNVKGIRESPELLKDIDFFLAWDMVRFDKYDIPFKRNSPIAYVLPSRGCPFKCVFCSNPVWKFQKPWVRMRTPKNVADEVKLLHDTYGVEEVYLRSDELNADVPWALKVCKEIEKLGLIDMTFQCQLRCDKVPMRLAEALQRIRCWLVHVGIEARSDRVLKGIQKHITSSQVVRACKNLAKYGVEVYGFFMLYNVWEENGRLQFESTREVEDTLRFADRLLKDNLLSYISWSIANPIVGSELHTIAEKYGLFSGNSLLPMKLPNVSRKEMVHSLRMGLQLQLKNGFDRGLMDTQNATRAMGKFRTLLELLSLEDKETEK